MKNVVRVKAGYKSWETRYIKAKARQEDYKRRGHKAYITKMANLIYGNSSITTRLKEMYG